MLDGSFEAMTDAEIIRHVLANPLDDLTGAPDPDDTTDPDDTHKPDDTTDTDGDRSDDTDNPDDPGAAGRGGGSGSSGGCGGGSGSGGGAAAGHAGDAPGETGQPAESGEAADAPGETDQPAESGEAADAPESASVVEASGCAAPELRMSLVSLVGQDEAPGQLPGWDVVPASLARRLAASMTGGEWRWVVCDPDGRAMDGGLITTRPRGTAPSGRARSDRRRGGIVELAVSQADLDRLAECPDRYGRWAGAIADIWRQYQQGRAGPPGRSGSRLGADQAGQAGQAGQRFPGARLGRWVQMRDRECGHPCCRAPAVSADVDHRVGWAAGGATIEQNLGPVCRRDHRIKDEGGWQVYQPATGVTVWISPLGHTITRLPPLVLPRPVERLGRDDRPPISGSWPDPCGCLIRPCSHDQQHRATDHGSDGDGQTRQGRWRFRLHDADDKPCTDRLSREYLAREDLYTDDLPPF
jgi:hypothetical protein